AGTPRNQSIKNPIKGSDKGSLGGQPARMPRPQPVNVPRKNEATMRGKRSRTTAISSDISSSSSSKRRSVAADDIEARWEVVEAAAETGVVEAAAAETGAAEAGPVVVSSSTETSKRAAEAVVKSEAVAAGAPFTTPPIASSGGWRLVGFETHELKNIHLSPGYRRRVCLDSLGWRGCLRCRLEELVQTGGKHPAPQFRREFDRVAPIKLWVLIEPIAQQTDPPSRSFNCLEIAQQDPLVHVKAGSSLQVRARSFELLPLWLGQVDCREAVLPHSGLVGVETPNFNQVVFSFKYAFVPPTQPESVTGPGFTARLDNQRDLPKFRAKGVEYVVHITNTEDLREVFADMLEVFKQDLAGDDFMAAKFESDNMLKAAHTPPHYVRITNSDKRCLLLRALVVACAYLQFVAKSITKQVWHTIKANSPTQTKLVAELQIEAGLYTTLQTVSQAGPFGDPCPEPAASGRDFGVRVYRAEEANRCIFNLPGTEILHLHLVEQHFNVVTKLPAFFGSHHYCPKCEMAYDSEPAKHKCADACSTCKTPGSNCKANRAYTYVDSGKQHRVHLVTAATSCEACPKLFPRPRCSACGDYTAQPIALRDAIWHWISRAVSRTMTVPGAIAIAHNGSAYDAFLLLGALLNGLAKKKPQVIFQNSRLMYMKCDKITFKDSLNFIPIGLAQFPKALGLGTQLTKGDFPHVFNQPQNWGYVGPYCSIDMYGGKKNKQHDSIADWLAKQEGQVFNFNKEYLDYCLQDTLLKYARLIKDICGLDAFVQSNTIAGLAMSVFTTKFMEPNTLGDEGAPVQQPIRLEDALFGGRTEAFVPHAEATETVELRYRDVVSLYPTVNKFDKYPLKAESSGSPGMAEDAKAAYMASFFEREGVRLEKVEENPGLRFVAKIFLNSLWGKFCQRDDLTSTEIVDSYEAWLQRLTDPSIKVKSCEPIGESFMMLEYKPRFGGAGERAFKYANVPIGVFTTSHARLRLYEALEGLGTRVIYADTDSVVYRCSRASTSLRAVRVWGSGLTRYLLAAACPKLYRYVVEKPDGSLYSVLKCKGIRVTPEISEREDELQEILRHGGTVRLPQAQFRRDKASCTIRTLEMDKTFQRVMTKR
uniref:DNA-directed DNA polymerase n=1 Tax=Macrostomum lignano TaxID=282301 RepID=A0A1I8FRH2_9PLAT